MEAVVLVLGAAAAILAVAALVIWGIWQALLLRYQEEPDAHEIHSVKTKDGWEIKLFRYVPEGEKGEPVLLCHGAFANHTNFTKPRGACLVDTLLEHGFDCWLIDFRGTRSSEPPLGRGRTSVQMDDYLLQDIPAALAFIRQVTGYAQVHWVGHSLGGMLLYAHVLVHGNHAIASGTTLGSPVGFAGTKVPRRSTLLAFGRTFPHLTGALMRTGGRLAVALHPRTSVFPINWKNVHPKVRGRDFFNMIETPPVKMSQELSDWATKKEWRMNNGELDVVANFNRLDLPLFAIYGAADPFVPVDEALAFVESIPNPHKQVMILGKEDGFAEDYNHVDLAFGKEGVGEVYEPIAAWLRENALGRRELREDVVREGRAFMARRVTLARAAEALAAVRAADLPAAASVTEPHVTPERDVDESPAVEATAPDAAADFDAAVQHESVAAPLSAPGTPERPAARKKSPAKKTSAVKTRAAAKKTTAAKKKASPAKTSAATKASASKKATPKRVTTNKKAAAKKPAAAKAAAPAKKKPAAAKPAAKKAPAKKKAAAKPKTTASRKTTAALRTTAAKRKAAAKSKTTAKRRR